MPAAPGARAQPGRGRTVTGARPPARWQGFARFMRQYWLPAARPARPARPGKVQTSVRTSSATPPQPDAETNINKTIIFVLCEILLDALEAFPVYCVHWRREESACVSEDSDLNYYTLAQCELGGVKGSCRRCDDNVRYLEDYVKRTV
ncbi:hypothetical protein EVAR_102213_1 [Eumeta japonica]|uniref:Uncharacterized protein n=1 Tax=Eumeta variegata TaxID=151549 RepID=A0A4C1WEG5_EUMVA|nr:hypothetical protein EVAR_102213_1 [Eumeta japonica]